MSNYTHVVQAARLTALQASLIDLRERRVGEGFRSSGIVAVDLFAGAGGLGLGAQWAGCDVRLAVDSDAIACETLRINEARFPGMVCEKDVNELSGADLRAMSGVGKKEPLILVGGPPCQGFSKAAFWTEQGDDARYRRARARGESAVRPPTPTAPPREDPRRSLVQEYWRLVNQSRADAFLFENVPSILAPRHRAIIDQLLRVAHADGYRTLTIKANAVEYGIPQRRQRVFVLGVRGQEVRAPNPTHALKADSSKNGLLAPITAGEALNGLEDTSFLEPEAVVRGKWAKHLEEVPPGWNYKFHTAWAGHPNPTFVTETRFWNFLLKLSPDLPSWTVAANPGPWTGPFHWSSRRLRTVELAALQTFPIDYEFAGNRRDRVRQIGNAVPPKLARRMIEPILEALGARVL